MREGPWGQAVPSRSLNQKPYHLGEFRFSAPKVRPDPVFGPLACVIGQPFDNTYAKKVANAMIPNAAAKFVLNLS